MIRHGFLSMARRWTYSRFGHSSVWTMYQQTAFVCLY